MPHPSDELLSQRPCLMHTLADMAVPPPPVRPSVPLALDSPSSRPWFAFISIVMLVLFVANWWLLRTTQAGVQAAELKAAAEAKPAAVVVTVINDPNCTVCFNVQELTAVLQANPKVQITTNRTVSSLSDEGKGIVTARKLTRLPAAVISGDVAKLLSTADFLSQYGQTDADGDLVLSKVPAPYVELATQEIRGKFSVTYLTDKECQGCYDVTVHRTVLKNFGMPPTEEKTIDRSDKEGKDLVERYRIESAPTILLTGDLAAYPNFLQAWSKVGTAEADGTFIFRAGQTQMGTYYDLKTKKVIQPPASQSASNGATGQ